MKGKKRYFVLIFLLVIFGTVLYLTKESRKDTIKKEEEKIKKQEKKSIELTTIVSIDKDKYGDIEEVLGSFFILKKDDFYYLLDNKGNEVRKSKTPINIYKDENNSKTYYTFDNALYDQNNNVVYDKLIDRESLRIYDDVIVITTDEVVKIINLSTKEVIEANGFVNNYNGIYVYIKDDKIIAFDGEEHEFENISLINEYEFLHLSTDNSDLYLNKEKGKITKEEYNKQKLNDEYYLDYEKCGQLKRIKDDETISNECFYQYNKVTDKFYVLVSEKDELYFFINNNLEKKDDFFTGNVADDKYYAPKGDKDNNYYLFYDNGDKEEFECASYVTYAGNNVFACNDYFENYFIENNKIREDKYDNIDCIYGSDYCTVKKDNKYGLYYRGKKIIEPNYQNIEVNNDYIIIDSSNKYYILYTEEGAKALTKEQINIKEDDNNTVNIDEVIKNNNLEEYKDLINDNKEMFIKYASAVESNDGLGEYKKYVYDYFKVVVDKKEYIDDSVFYKKLGTLKFEVKDKLVTNGASGEYWSNKNEIQLNQGYKKDASVIYHELMHFIDYALNDNTPDIMFKMNDKFITKEEYTKLDMPEKREVQIANSNSDRNDVIVEGGAEKNSGKYFFDGSTATYQKSVIVYNILEYIFGFDKIESVYYGNVNLYSLMKDYVDIESFEKFIDANNSITRISENEINADYVTSIDFIYNLYINKNGKDIHKDEVFSLLLYSLINNYRIDNLKGSKYYTEYLKVYNNENEKLATIRKKLENRVVEYDFYQVLPKVLVDNNKIYVFYYCGTGIMGLDTSYKRGYIKTEYNIETKDFKVIKYIDEKNVNNNFDFN